MSLPVVIYLSAVILAATHTLDTVLKRCGIKKSLFLFYMAVSFAVSLTPVYNMNRYFSLHLLCALFLISFAALLTVRKKTLLAAKEITLIFFVLFLFILETILILVLIKTEWFYYIKLAGIVLYCAIYIEKPADAAICAGFGIWLLQLLLGLRNLILDAYIYFDLGNSETANVSLLCALGAFILSFLVLLIKERKKGKKEITGGMELFPSSEKK